jgi:hypothetical protein
MQIAESDPDEKCNAFTIKSEQLSRPLDNPDEGDLLYAAITFSRRRLHPSRGARGLAI